MFTLIVTVLEFQRYETLGTLGLNIFFLCIYKLRDTNMIAIFSIFYNLIIIIENVWYFEPFLES